MKKLFLLTLCMSLSSALVIGFLKYISGIVIQSGNLSQVGLYLYYYSSYTTLLVGVAFAFYIVKKSISMSFLQIISMALLYAPMYIVVLSILKSTIAMVVGGWVQAVAVFKFSTVMFALSIFMERGNAATSGEIFLNVLQLMFSIAAPIIAGFVTTYVVLNLIKRRST